MWSSRVTIVGTLLLGASAVCPQAAALTCVPTPTNQPSSRQVAESGQFGDRFDGALDGVVEAVATGQGQQPVARFLVEKSYGESLPTRVEIVGSHWVPLEVGARYFVPYSVNNGRREVHLCWDTPERLSPASATTPQTPTTAAPDTGDEGRAAAVLLVLAGLGVAGPGGWLLTRRVRGGTARERTT